MTAQRFAVAGLGSVWDVLDRDEADMPVIEALCIARERDIQEQQRRS